LPIILATQRAENRRITVQSQPRQIVCKTLSQKTLHEIRAGEWLKVKAMRLFKSHYWKRKKKKDVTM
jgi:hypothetical protein